MPGIVAIRIAGRLSWRPLSFVDRTDTLSDPRERRSAPSEVDCPFFAFGDARFCGRNSRRGQPRRVPGHPRREATMCKLVSAVAVLGLVVWSVPALAFDA